MFQVPIFLYVDATGKQPEGHILQKSESLTFLASILHKENPQTEKIPNGTTVTHKYPD